MSNWKKYIIGKWSWKRPLYSLFSIYLLLLVVVIFFADRLIFVPPSDRYSEDLPGFEYLINDKDQQVAIIYQKADKNMPTLLWSHGNAEDISHTQHFMHYLHEKGYGILAYDYPGYGLSEGKPNEKGCYLNIQATWAHLTETLSISEKEIIIIGQSVGSGPSVWLAEQQQPKGLVLISPFKSINRVPFGFNPFPYDRFPNIDRIENVSCPLLVIHGEKDGTINYSHGKAVYDKHLGKKTMLRVKGADHNDILSFKEVKSGLFSFLKAPSSL